MTKWFALALVLCVACGKVTPTTSSALPITATLTSASSNLLTPTANAARSPVPPRPPVTETANPTVPHADIIINPGQFGNTIQVSVGQTIAVPPLNETMEWQVDYVPALLVPLTPPEKMRAPGAQGWLFRVVKAGTSELALTSIAQCPPGQLCPANVIRMVVTIQAK